MNEPVGRGQEENTSVRWKSNNGIQLLFELGKDDEMKKFNQNDWLIFEKEMIISQKKG